MISILVVIICFFNFDINFNNIKDYNKRFDQYKNTSDKKFLKSKEIDLIDSLTPVIKNYECIQLFSNEVALLYLLRVKSCSKFYFIWSVGSFVNQKKLINSLKENSLIIAGGESFDWDMPLSKKLSYVNTYIDENFTEILLSHKFRVLKRIE